MAKFLLNAFSCSMVPDGAMLEIIPVTDSQAKEFAVEVETLDRPSQSGEIPQAWLAATSAIGHADTAAVISGILGVQVPVNRVSVKLVPGHDAAIVAQYSGPRLPEGAKVLPDGAEIKWFAVRVHSLAALGRANARIQKLEAKLLEVLGEEGVEGL
jgi:hypothetical protein